MELEPIAPIGQISRLESWIQWHGESRPLPESAIASVTNGTPAPAGNPNDVALEQMGHFKQMVQEKLQTLDARLVFRLDEDSGKMIAEIRDRSTGELLRQVPPEEMMRLAKAISQFLGLVVDERH